MGQERPRRRAANHSLEAKLIPYCLFSALRSSSRRCIQLYPMRCIQMGVYMGLSPDTNQVYQNRPKFSEMAVNSAGVLQLMSSLDLSRFPHPTKDLLVQLLGFPYLHHTPHMIEDRVQSEICGTSFNYVLSIIRDSCLGKERSCHSGKLDWRRSLDDAGAGGIP